MKKYLKYLKEIHDLVWLEIHTHTRANVSCSGMYSTNNNMDRVVKVVISHRAEAYKSSSYFLLLDYIFCFFDSRRFNPGDI